MLISDSGGQPRGARDRVQAYPGTRSGTSGLRFRSAQAVLAAFGLLLSGCSSFPSSMNPVTWWHDLQGGKIAEQRPPPPGADQPYPNLATVPPKPAEPDRAALANIANGLIADRTNTQRADAAAPIADPSSPSASPALFGKGTVPPPPPPPPPGTTTASASLPAADAPPAPPSPAPSPPSPSTASPAPAAAPAKAPVGAVQTAELPPPAAPGGPAAGPVSAKPEPNAPEAPGAAAQPGVAAALAPPAANAPLTPPGASAQPTPEAAPAPPLPTTPPPPPNLPAAGGAPATPAGLPPAAAPPPGAPATTAAATPAPPPNSANSVNLTFVDGSADLPPTAASTLKALAARRGGGIIAITGYGDAVSNDPDAQSAALKLGLSRAQAMAAALTSAGVPGSAVQVDAEAIGRGGAARLVK
jgi:outer membrane protein OmpA-like peptidoglycan-associated protein